MLSIPFTPGDLLFFILLSLLATASGVTTNCPNLSPPGPLNFASDTGDEIVYYLVNTELKSILNSSAIKYPCVIMFHYWYCPPVAQPYLEHSAYF